MADLSYENLSGADLSGAKLANIKMNGAILCGTKMPWGVENKDCK